MRRCLRQAASDQGKRMTGAEWRAHRIAARLTQKALAKRASVSISAVKYWERKTQIDPYGWAVVRLAKALGISNRIPFMPNNARAGGWGLTAHAQIQARMDAQVELKIVAWRQRETARAARRRVTCGAKTRKATQCRNLSEPGKKRCKFHGGKSTGPKTTEGKTRIAAAQRTRWAKWRVSPP